MNERPRLLITMGDVAGIGPEIIARAWPDLIRICHPSVVGDPAWLEWALKLTGVPATVQRIRQPADSEPADQLIPCIPGSALDLRQAQPGRVNAAAGKAAYDFLCTAIDHILAGAAQSIVTAP